MVFPTAITHDVPGDDSGTDVKDLGHDRRSAMENLFMATSRALTGAAHNATSSQQQSDVTGQAGITQDLVTRYRLDTTVTGAVPSKMIGPGQ